MEMPGYFEKNIVLPPDYCGQTAELSPLAAFTLFQAIASEHAEYTGVGNDAMAARGQFWLTLHTRVDFFGSARMSQEVTAATWPEPCSHHALRCYRSYSLRRGDELLALGRTQWAVLEPEGRLLPLVRDVFPADYAYCGRTGITDAPTRFHDDFTPADEVFTHTVRSTDIDAGHHMNNVAYVRVLLDCFPAAVLAGGDISSIEVHYAAVCREGEVLTVCRKGEGNLCRLAIKKPDGTAAVLASVRFKIKE